MLDLQAHSAVETGFAPCVRLPVLLMVADPQRLNVAREALIELELGWEVIFVADKESALAVAETRELDLVVIDLANVYVEPVDLVDAIRGQSARLPLVLMSAPFGVSVALEGMRHGATNHFPRELLDREPQSVLDSLNQLARDYQAERQALRLMSAEQFDFCLTNNRKQIAPIVERVKVMVQRHHRCTRAEAVRIGVATEEALLNSMIHGNLEVSSDLRQNGEQAYEQAIAERAVLLPYRARQVRGTVRVTPMEISISITDEGPGFDPSKLPDPTDPENLFRIGGRGLLLIRSFMSTVEFNETGNQVTLVKRRA